MIPAWSAWPAVCGLLLAAGPPDLEGPRTLVGVQGLAIPVASGGADGIGAGVLADVEYRFHPRRGLRIGYLRAEYRDHHQVPGHSRNWTVTEEVEVRGPIVGILVRADPPARFGGGRMRYGLCLGYWTRETADPAGFGIVSEDSVLAVLGTAGYVRTRGNWEFGGGAELAGIPSGGSRGFIALTLRLAYTF